MKEKIGVSIITCNRKDFLLKLIDSLNGCKYDELVIINDGEKLDIPHLNQYIVNNDTNLGVAKSKNKAFQHLLDAGCDYIFLIEDDMKIKRKDIFQAYINASKKSGVEHMMFAYHGPANKNGISGGIPCPRLIVNYGDFTLSLNQHCVGAFCYYTRESLETCGLIDEKFENAFDHVSHSYELYLKGFSTPYWWWADLGNSLDYIEEQACSENSSSIKTPEKMEKWRNNINSSCNYFKEKFGVFPFGVDGVKDTPEEVVIELLKYKKL